MTFEELVNYRRCAAGKFVAHACNARTRGISRLAKRIDIRYGDTRARVRVN